MGVEAVLALMKATPDLEAMILISSKPHLVVPLLQKTMILLIIYSFRMGVEAVLALMKATPDSEAMVVSLDGNSSVCVPLMECVHKTQAVARAMATKNFEVSNT